MEINPSSLNNASIKSMGINLSSEQWRQLQDILDFYQIDICTVVAQAVLAVLFFMEEEVEKDEVELLIFKPSGDKYEIIKQIDVWSKIGEVPEQGVVKIYSFDFPAEMFVGIDLAIDYFGVDDEEEFISFVLIVFIEIASEYRQGRCAGTLEDEDRINELFFSFMK